MEILAWIMVGIVAGWLTGLVFKSSRYWGNMLVGVGGALAGFISGGSVTTAIDPTRGFNLLPLALPVLGAVLLVTLLQLGQRYLGWRPVGFSNPMGEKPRQ